MSIPTKTRVFVLNNPPKTTIEADTFRIEERDIPELKDGEVLIKPIAYDNMPALRGWIGASADPKRLYAPPITKGQVIRTPAISEVIESKSSKWTKGQRVTGMPGWVEYAVVKESEITGEAASIKGQSEWISIGGLGVTGLTAWAGAFDVIPNLNKDQVVVVSGAAGGVGTAFLQIAKHVVGCKKVIGIAGGKEKCEYVKSLGADDCIDYKSESFNKDLKEAVPDFVDVFFDNVGGAVLNAVFGVMNRFGFIAVCGAIDGYNGKPPQLPNWFEVISQRLTIKGFILSDHVKKFGQARQEMEQWVNEGKISFDDRETVVDTKFEDVPKVWQKLFDGSNTGKLITKLNGQ